MPNFHASLCEMRGMGIRLKESHFQSFEFMTAARTGG